MAALDPKAIQAAFAGLYAQHPPGTRMTGLADYIPGGRTVEPDYGALELALAGGNLKTPADERSTVLARILGRDVGLHMEGVRRIVARWLHGTKNDRLGYAYGGHSYGYPEADFNPKPHMLRRADEVIAELKEFKAIIPVLIAEPHRKPRPSGRWVLNKERWDAWHAAKLLGGL